jgi:hypothetical protein
MQLDSGVGKAVHRVRVTGVQTDHLLATRAQRQRRRLTGAREADDQVGAGRRLGAPHPMLCR